MSDPLITIEADGDGYVIADRRPTSDGHVRYTQIVTPPVAAVGTRIVIGEILPEIAKAVMEAVTRNDFDRQRRRS